MNMSDLKWHIQGDIRYAYSPESNEFFVVRPDEDDGYSWEIFSTYEHDVIESGWAETLEEAMLLEGVSSED